jgi:hypothetical protein
MMIENKRPQMLAGIMGRNAAQPAQMLGQMTVNPLERLQQKMAGRTQGRALDGVKQENKRSKTSILTSYGMS